MSEQPTNEPEAPPTSPGHPDDIPEQAPEDLDIGGDPVEADDAGVDDLLPDVTDDPAITED